MIQTTLGLEMLILAPNTLDAEKQHEQEQQQEMNDPDNFGFGDVNPNTLEAEE